MTGGRVVILGSTGRNFAAGMSGGIAYVLDETGDFATARCNHELVDLEDITEQADIDLLKEMIYDHEHLTGSKKASLILKNWNEFLPKFIKVMPRPYKEALQKMAEEKERLDRERREQAIANQE